MGFLAKEAGIKFGEKSLSGGPLGELVQWSDLIACLHILGHKLVISTETATLIKFSSDDTTGACLQNSQPYVDLIFTDIMGLKHLKKKTRAFFTKYKCRLRVLDSFGTQAEFNLNSYWKSHKTQLGGKNPWGGHELLLSQFYTMYPHTDDNTFLGFVVETHAMTESVERRNWTLIYGKERYMWNGKERALSVVAKYSPIHATLSDGKNLLNGAFPQITDHGLQSGPDFHLLLRHSKLFMGLGFPLEGPAPLEAIANGAVFINPRFSPPRSRQTDRFLSDKPTQRQVLAIEINGNDVQITSQNPYTERFIGSPHVLTVSLDNDTELEAAVKMALTSSVKPLLPFEFTTEGMLERVNSFVQNQDFCSPFSDWPPISSAHFFLAQPGASCQNFCALKGFICEPSYFARLNSAGNLQRYNSDCIDPVQLAEPWAPSDCHLQAENLLFSCATIPPEGVRRLCPCRDYRQGQMALCKEC